VRCVASLIIIDHAEASLGSPEGLQGVENRELRGATSGLGWSQLTRLGLGWSQLARLGLSWSQLRLRSRLEPAVKLSELRLLSLELWGHSELLRPLLRSGPRSAATEGSEGSQSLA